MYKETITYTGYDGKVRTGDFYFNLNKAEVIKLETSVKGGIAEELQNLINAENTPELMDIFQRIMDMSYGVRDVDGVHFYKRPSDLEDFKATEAYSELYTKLATDDVAAAAFIKGVLPSDLDTIKRKPVDVTN